MYCYMQKETCWAEVMSTLVPLRKITLVPTIIELRLSEGIKLAVSQ